jgi:multidrug efflux pump subunit AcrB
MDFIVLSDLGAEEAAAFRSVFNAALLGAVMVALVVFLLGGRNAPVLPGLFCAISIPLVCLVSAAVMAAAGFSVNRLSLAGIACGTGTAVDAVILCSERLRRSQSRRVNYAGAAAALSELKDPLLAGAATTVAALIPLFAVEEGGVKVIASAVSAVTVTALVISLFLLPPLLLWRGEPQKNAIAAQKRALPSPKSSRPGRLSRRFLAAAVRFCVRRPALVLAACLALTAAAVLSLFARGVDTSGYASEDSVYAQIEFDGGLLPEEIDRRLAVYGERLAESEGILNVETGARTGSASLLVSFDPARIKAGRVRQLAKSVPIDGGFVFFHESSAKERYWEIKIYGDSEQTCRKIAEEFAYACSGSPLINDLVFNFKAGSKKLVLTPDRHLFAEAGISFSEAAAKVRLGVFGPVAYKRTGGRGETDVRIATGAGGAANGGFQKSKEEALGVLVSTIRAGTLMRAAESAEPSSLRRDNRRSTASVTITTKSADPRRIREKISPLFEKLDLPPGYSLEFDPGAIKAGEALSATVFSLVLAIVFCYMIIASINESFLMPLIVLSAVPPSLAFPALALALSGGAYTPAAACAFIAVSGMTVNAAVLCADGIRRTKNIYTALRKKLPALLATTGTTVAGALPFLFLKEGANAMIKTLSLVGAMGVAASCICSITLIPSLFTILKKHIPLERGKNHDLGRHYEK